MQAAGSTQQGGERGPAHRRRHALTAALAGALVVAGGGVLAGTSLAPAQQPPARLAAAAACSIPPVVLLEAHTVKGRVAVEGLARSTSAGQRATLEALVGSKRLGTAVGVTVAGDGRFRGSMALPKRSKRSVVRYRATVSGKRSQTLKLKRKMVITSRRATAAGTRVSGRISGNAGRWTLTVTRQRCAKTEQLKQVRTTRKGAFSILLPRPAATDPVTLFRARAKLGRKKTFSEIILATVPPAQHAPLAAADAVSTPEDATLTIPAAQLLANDSDPDSDALAVAGVRPNADIHGTVALAGTTLTYAPARDYNGPASFEYTVSDGHGHAVDAVVAVFVGPAQDPPVAADDAAVADEDAALAISPSTLLANDHDPDGDALSVDSVTGGADAHGTVALAGGSVTYTPAADFAGEAQFGYTISDGHGNSAGARVRVTVRDGQEAPVARDDAAETLAGQRLAIAHAELLANDSDADRDALTVTAVAPSAATHGTVALAGTSAVYVPEPGYTGDATFAYTVSDGHGNTASANAIVAVRGAQAPPAAGCARPPRGLVAWWRGDGDANDRITGAGAQLLRGASFATGISGQAFAFDGDDDAVAIASTGPLTRPGPLTVEFWFQPFSGVPRTDSGAHSFFSKGPARGIGWVNATAAGGPPLARIEVRGPSPAASSGALELAAGRWHHVAVALDGAGYALYVDGEPAGVSADTASILSVADDIALGFGPRPSPAGADTPYHGAIDEVSVYDRALALSEVRAIHDAAGGGKCPGAAPDAVDDARQATEDTTLVVAASSLLANDSDPDGDDLTLTQVTGGPASHGTVALAGGQVTYVPAADFNGAASFAYTVSDGLGHSATATVAVTVGEVNDDPTAVADAKSVTGRALTLPAADLLSNDAKGPANESSQSLTVTSVTPSSTTHGDVTLALGSISYTADAGFNGDATFGYEVCDDGTTAGGADPRCDDGVVTVSVTQTPVMPVADDISIATDEDDDVGVTLSATVAGGAPLTYAIVDPPAHGTVAPGGTGVAGRTYTPAAQFNGADSFTYRASDGTTSSNTATVTITVREVNDPPVTAADTKHALRDQALTFPAADLLSNDQPGPANESAQTLSVTSIDAGVAAHGTATLAAGQVTYTPDAGFEGAATLTYRACDDGRTAGADDPRCADETVAIDVGDATLTSLAVTPAGQSIEDGETQQYHATGTFSDGSSRDVDDVDWTSSEPAIANITAGGLARGAEPGTTTITATKGAIHGETSLTVTAAPVSSIVVEPASHTMLAGDTQVLHATGVLGDGTSESLDGQVAWSTSDDVVATVDAGGTVTGTGEGTATIRATLGSVSGTASVTIHVPVVDTVAPVAVIASPGDDAEITEPTDIVGTATDDGFLKYTLQIAPVGETAFTTLAEGTDPVADGVLGQLDPTLMRNDLYSVRLTVYDRGGNTTVDTVVYQVSRDEKVGNFSIGFQDVDVPLSGIPITVNRVYDSRDKRQGDFGVGWRLDVQTLQVRVTEGQGEGWQVNRSGGFFPTYTMVATDTHKVSVTLGDGRVEEFDLRPDPPSSVLLPFQFMTATYQPRSGTLGTLQPADGTGLYVDGAQPGSVTLLDDSEFNAYNPRLFEYTAPNGQVYVLGPGGVQSVRDPNGNTLTFGPGGITHSSGVGVTFARDAQGRITDITDPMGNVNHYAYDARGDLASHTDPSGNRTRFAYNRTHGLIEIRDPRGTQAARNEYDDDGRLIAIIDAAGHRTTFEHDLDGRQEVIRDRRGNATVYEYDEEGNVVRKTDPLGGVTLRTFDARGNELSVTDPLGHVSTSEYDARGNVTKEVDATGATVTRTFNERSQILTETDASGATTTYDYDANGNLLSHADPRTGTVSSTFDGRGNRLATTDAAGNPFAYTYDAAGMMLSQTEPSGAQTTFANDANGNRVHQTRTRTDSSGAQVPVEMNAVYDDQDRLVQLDDGATHMRTEYGPTGQTAATIDGRGNRTSYDYDGLGRLARTTYPDGTFETNAYDADGNRTASRDRAGRTTTYVYDAFNRIVRTTRPDGTSLQTTYDAAGRVSAKTDARGNTTRFEYDAAGRRLRMETPGGAVTTWEYDAAGRKTRQTDPRGKVTSYAYDPGGNLVQTTFPDGTSSSSTYDAAGRRATATDEAGAQTSLRYDALGRLDQVTDALGGETSYAYDEVGNLVAATDARSHTTRFDYDDGGRVIGRTLALGQLETYGYDANGNAVSHTDFNGATTTSQYDAMDRLTRETRPDDTIAYEYTPSGALAAVQDQSGERRLTYDDRDRLRRVENPDGTAVDYGYDAADNRTTLTSPTGAASYTYDADGRLVDVTDPAGGQTHYAYDASGNRTSATLPNGTRSAWLYDDRDRVTRAEHRRADGSLLGSYDYALNATGRRVGVAENGGRAVSYGYDALGRLVDEDLTDPVAGDRDTTYAYDAVGNRVSSTSAAATTNYAYDANDRLTTAGTESLDYDDNGNLVRRAGPLATTTFAYDSANRLVATGGPAGSATFRYDAAGNRIGATTGATSKSYLVDTNAALPTVLEERSGVGSPATRYVVGDDRISRHRGGDASYYHADALGSTRLLTGPGGTTTDTYDYDAFGNDAGSTGATPNDFRFRGEQLEPEAGTYNLRARHYDPTTGRFVSLDPTVLGDLEQPLSAHEYIYANDDPVNMADPTGLQTMGELSISMDISITLDTIAVANYLRLLAQVAVVVGQAAVAACATAAVVSAVTAIGSGNRCDVTKYNVFYSGWNTPETTTHIIEALSNNPRWANLHRISPPHSRAWLALEPSCDGRSRYGDWCDEYPFASAREGGQANGPSLKLVPAGEQQSQGGSLGAFYGACKVLANDPIEGAFGVVPGFTPLTFGVCK